MQTNWKIEYFKPTQEGVQRITNGFRFTTALPPSNEESGLILYAANGETFRFAFSEQYRQGNLLGIQLKGPELENYYYNYYQGNSVFTDLYAQELHGLEEWGGTENEKPRATYGCLRQNDFLWKNDKPLQYPYEECIIYGLDVRAFSMHKSANVQNPGTFEGIIEKIPYLKSLGITTLELMPCYEYEECLYPAINCWGFQTGFYFAPKASYSAVKNPIQSFKSMVRELHAHKIEVLMQFYFPTGTPQLYMLEVLQYWVSEYHVDGFRMNGCNIPVRMLSENAFLKQTKIWFTELNESEITPLGANQVRNLSRNHQGYRDEVRRFLKGDDGFMNQFLYFQRHNPKDYAVINSLADYDGFSLYDTVSYERKHNETNGEYNQDGTDLNFSWNCGIEGDTRRKAVLSLRLRQLKNAFSLLLLSQGTPFIFSGDEMANTRYGNNNAYCQDNEIGWIKWEQNPFSSELHAYVKSLIQLRKTYQILHMPTEFRMMDHISCGTPDLSYHGEEAWQPDLSHMSHTIGIALCGKYAEPYEPSFYIAINMHWENQTLALPKLPKNSYWTKIEDTAELNSSSDSKLTTRDFDYETNDHALIQARSIAVYQSKEVSS